MSQSNGNYYLPEPTKWPIIGSIGLFTTLFGLAHALPHGSGHIGNLTMCFVGLGILAIMMIGWFSQVVSESQAGRYNEQVDRSFRLGMMWFIFSEVMFFGAFFGALFYVRELAGPWLGGAGNNAMTHELLYKGYQYAWPSNGPGDVGGAFKAMGPWGIPALNTLILLTSGLTVTWAHWGLKKGNRRQLIIGLFLTVALGFLFVTLQAHEYSHAYHEMNLKLSTGIYGSTFFILTGFHGAHVTIGAIMLTVMLFRSMKGHFNAQHHFAFEAAAWYWHFVDVVWLGLFIFVYWL